MPTKWVSLHKCTGCKKALSSADRYDRDGVCIHCGQVTDCSVCDTFKSSREVEVPPRDLRSPLKWLWDTFWGRG
jgi:hypothetical protein